MTISKIFGLPAHPLLVHVPVVLIPLTALGAIAMACSARVRERFGWLVLAVGVVAGLSTQLAVESGQALRASVPKSAALRHHATVASSIRPLILALFLVALAVMLVDRRARGAWPFRALAPRDVLGTAGRAGLVALAVLAAVATTARLYQIGDSGARATWQRIHLKPAASREGRV